MTSCNVTQNNKLTFILPFLWTRCFCQRAAATKVTAIINASSGKLGLYLSGTRNLLGHILFVSRNSGFWISWDFDHECRSYVRRCSCWCWWLRSTGQRWTRRRSAGASPLYCLQTPDCPSGATCCCWSETRLKSKRQTWDFKSIALSFLVKGLLGCNFFNSFFSVFSSSSCCHLISFHISPSQTHKHTHSPSFLRLCL